MNIRYLLSTLCAGVMLGMGATDRNIPAGYYTAMDGKTGAALKTAAYECIKGQTVISYGDNTWTVFQDSDVRPDGTWWDIYSNNKVQASSGHSGMNIEHAVANSWWGKTKIDAYKDIHHLFPADSNANSRKSNYPLGETDNPTWTNGVTIIGKAASGSKGGTGGYVYEPADEYKGDNARVYFYMAVRYPDITWKDTDSGYEAWIQFNREDYPTLVAYAQELLLKWARNDEVSQKGIDRNEAIYKHQKNRNPFVDFPGLEEYIWGDKKNVAFDLEAMLKGESSINSIKEATPFSATPCAGGLTISCEGSVTDLRIFDMSGRTVLSLTDVADGTTITLAGGIYIVSAGPGSRPIKVMVR